MAADIETIRRDAPKMIRDSVAVPEHSLREVVHGVSEGYKSLPFDERRPNNIAHWLADPQNAEALKDIEQRFGEGRKYGFQNVGDRALILTFNDQKGDVGILRLTRENEQAMPGSKNFHAPEMTVNHGGISIAVSQPVITLEQMRDQGTLSAKDAEALNKQINREIVRDGYVATDPHLGNAGVTADGRFVVIDSGAAMEKGAYLAHIDNQFPETSFSRGHFKDAVAKDEAALKGQAPLNDGVKLKPLETDILDKFDHVSRTTPSVGGTTPAATPAEPQKPAPAPHAPEAKAPASATPPHTQPAAKGPYAELGAEAKAGVKTGLHGVKSNMFMAGAVGVAAAAVTVAGGGSAAQAATAFGDTVAEATPGVRVAMAPNAAEAGLRGFGDSGWAVGPVGAAVTGGAEQVARGVNDLAQTFGVGNDKLDPGMVRGAYDLAKAGVKAAVNGVDSRPDTAKIMGEIDAIAEREKVACTTATAAAPTTGGTALEQLERYGAHAKNGRSMGGVKADAAKSPADPFKSADATNPDEPKVDRFGPSATLVDTKPDAAAATSPTPAQARPERHAASMRHFSPG